jgi:soluble lytic murein transglycosylase-like protein
MEKLQVYELCKLAGKKHGFDPILLLAVCQQESNFNHTEMRLENGFYRKYARPLKFASSTEGLFALSWGLMQTMGLILWEEGYFKYHFSLHDKSYHEFYKNDNMHEVHVCKAINYYMDNPALQVDWGAKHLTTKRKATSGDINKMLLAWNGGGNKNYDDEVLEKENKLRIELA